jgi:quercetin 2,3-dioxygenase
MSLWPVKKLSKAKPTLEGAGVHLRRAFGFASTSDFDPFLGHCINPCTST